MRSSLLLSSMVIARSINPSMNMDFDIIAMICSIFICVDAFELISKLKKAKGE